MTSTRWVWAIWCSAVAALGGCESDSEVGTCLLLFEYAYNDQDHIEGLTLDQNGDGSVDARVTYTNTYTDEDVITEVVTKCVESDDSVRYETRHELNERGQTVFSLYEGDEIRVYIHEFGESKSVEQSTFTYTGEYDEHHRLVKDTIDLDADNTPDEVKYHSFDDGGYREKLEIDEGADGSIDFTINYRYTFTERGSYETIVQEEVGLITKVTEYAYQYDEEGKRTKRTVDIRQDGILEEVCTYSYDEEGNRTEEFCEYFTNGALIRERTQQYDSKGNLIMSLTMDVDDGAASRGTYIYDDEGNRLSALSEGRENERAEWEETLLRTYTYDDEGTRLSETREIYNWGPSTRTCADRYLPGSQMTLSR